MKCTAVAQAALPAKSIGLLIGLSLLLGACGSLPKPGVAPALYDFGISPAATATVIPVKLTRVEAIPGLEGVDMRYRLAYQNPTQVFAYTESRWAAAPADLLAQRLRHRGFSSTSPCNLHVTLESFDQLFDSPSSSHVFVSLRADIISGRGAHTLSDSTQITAKSPTGSADARGGVTALATAADEAIGKLVEWVKQQECGK